MNETKIDWTDYSWNPLVGCKHGCWYCYAKELNNKHKWIPNWEDPQYYEERLSQPYTKKKPKKIFVGSMTDLFGDWVTKEYIYKVLEVIKDCNRHIFQLLTKNPKRYSEFEFPSNAWLGTTVESEAFMEERAKCLLEAKCQGPKFISFEPLLSAIPSLPKVDWIIIGAMTGKNAVSPDKRWVENIIKMARTNKIPIFVKKNVYWQEKIQEFPIFNK